MTHLDARLNNLRAEANRFGWGHSVASHFFRFAAHFLGIHVHVVRTKMLEADPEYPCKAPGIDFRLIENDELYDASTVPDLELSREFVRAAIERGDTAFGAFAGPMLVSFVWRAVAVAPHTNNVWVAVQHPYFYSYKSYTRPSHRGQRICPSVLLHSDVDMLARGFQARAGFVEIGNWASLAMGKHMRAKHIGYAGYLRWFGKCVFFRTRAVRRIHFAFCERTKSDLVN